MTEASTSDCLILQLAMALLRGHYVTLRKSLRGLLVIRRKQQVYSVFGLIARLDRIGLKSQIILGLRVKGKKCSGLVNEIEIFQNYFVRATRY